ncbi:MAG: flavodoxin-dependent (E)-4-hydroxy-3-methylbut-2-enyl-diphosphate synthase, partial [Candidatus Omnitrophica bacterium]|nr:flavodoxin-dependent (E)-4-hydroxy-3-methylbut-2-enyl-diphosphate synthase [Candidatus Omnitrophota bacterium]
MIKRRKTRTVKVGKVKIGSGHPVSVQSMAKTDTVNIRGTTAQIRELEAAGCEIVRVAVKTPEAARAIKEIKKEISIPIVADIHFDPALAIESVVAGA